MNTIIPKRKNILLNFFAISFFLLGSNISVAQVGINTVTPKSTFEVNGSFGQKVTTVTANTTLDDTYNLVICNNGSTAITITLPTATGISGRFYTVKREATSTANVTVAGTIDGVTDLILAKNGEAVTIFSNGTEWKTSNDYNSSTSSNWDLTGNTGTIAGTNFVGTTDAKDLVLKTNNTERMRVLSGGNVGIGVTSPTAYLQIKAGTTAAGTAPLKLTDGPLMTTVEPGCIEYKEHTFYASTYLVRRSIMLAQDVVVANVPVTNTSTETTIYTSTMAANYLTVGKLVNIKLYGNYRTRDNGPTFTIRVKEGSNVILTTTSNATTASSLRPWDIDIRFTIRSIGSSGSVISYGKIQQDNVASNADYNTSATFDTTVNNSVTVTIQWSEAHANDQFNLIGGATECIDANN